MNITEGNLPHRWGDDFDYVYFTESDQILLMRIAPQLYVNM